MEITEEKSINIAMIKEDENFGPQLMETFSG